eukprot:9174899-Karenia_brevis.AAC.1
MSLVALPNGAETFLFPPSGPLKNLLQRRVAIVWVKNCLQQILLENAPVAEVELIEVAIHAGPYLLQVGRLKFSKFDVKIFLLAGRNRVHMIRVQGMKTPSIF